jgi:hypothetical protein
VSSSISGSETSSPLTLSDPLTGSSLSEKPSDLEEGARSEAGSTGIGAGSPGGSVAGSHGSVPTNGATKRATKSQAKATRVPDDFQPPPKDVERFRREGYDCLAHVEEFVDYWRGIPGTKGTNLDWHATFRNRIRSLIKWGECTEWTAPRQADRPLPPSVAAMTPEECTSVRSKIADEITKRLGDSSLQEPT